MTMHLMRGLSTTSTRKRKIKITKRKQAELALLNYQRKKEGLEPLDTMVAPKTHKSKFTALKPSSKPQHACYREGAGVSKIPSLPFTGDVCARPADKVYSGGNILGIGTLHKSNAVPIFSSEEAKDIAKMRR